MVSPEKQLAKIPILVERMRLKVVIKDSPWGYEGECYPKWRVGATGNRTEV